jgi:hypothetical protein
MDIDLQDIKKFIWNNPIVAGAAGSCIAAVKFAAPGTGAFEKGVNFVSGALAAGYLSPPLCAYLKMTTPEYTLGAAFVLGFLSMSIAAAILGGIRETPWGAILTGWFSRR